MTRKFIYIAALAAACVTTACGDSDTMIRPSLLSRASNANSTALGGAPSDRPPTAGASELGPLTAGSCSMIANGIEVVVGGNQQGNGTLLADHVSQVPPGTQPAPANGTVVVNPGSSSSGSFAQGDALGTVTGIQGECPNLTFTVGGRTVVTNETTRFYGLPRQATS